MVSRQSNEMAEPNVDEEVTAEDAEVASGYRAPAQKSVKDIITTDAEDESLRKYKEALLGSAVGGDVEVCKYRAGLHFINIIFILFLYC